MKLRRVVGTKYQEDVWKFSGNTPQKLGIDLKLLKCLQTNLG